MTSTPTISLSSIPPSRPVSADTESSTSTQKNKRVQWLPEVSLLTIDNRSVRTIVHTPLKDASIGQPKPHKKNLEQIKVDNDTKRKKLTHKYLTFIQHHAPEALTIVKNLGVPFQHDSYRDVAALFSILFPNKHQRQFEHHRIDPKRLAAGLICVKDRSESSNATTTTEHLHYAYPVNDDTPPQGIPDFEPPHWKKRKTD